MSESRFESIYLQVCENTALCNMLECNRPFVLDIGVKNGRWLCKDALYKLEDILYAYHVFVSAVRYEQGVQWITLMRDWYG